jgi:hypothetical protein
VARVTVTASVKVSIFGVVGGFCARAVTCFYMSSKTTQWHATPEPLLHCGLLSLRTLSQ